ncbi:uncharacterized protein LOC143158909 [Aptenodytes patagonicus]|uniref:uncharacterized protein LOC143158909 n=1 Tax=Aptenodytes patagonicus TaxID=9234 RepID=UPI003FA1906D
MDTRLQDGAEALLEGCPTAEVSEGARWEQRPVGQWTVAESEDDVPADVPGDVPEPADGELTPREDKAAAGIEHPRQEWCRSEPRVHRVLPKEAQTRLVLAGEAGRSAHRVPGSTS